MFFGDKLKNILEIKNISQKEFASELNIAPTTLNGYINNKREPDFELVKKIASHLNVSIDYLFDYSTDNFSLDERELILLENYRQLSLSQKTLIDNLIALTISQKNAP